jgi:hypothetical protein
LPLISQGQIYTPPFRISSTLLNGEESTSAFNAGNGNFSDFYDAWLHRQVFWASAFLDWLAVLSITGWLAVVSVSLFLGGLSRPAA